jgi:hypothetical protein
LSLEKEFFSFSATKLANRSDIPRHNDLIPSLSG